MKISYITNARIPTEKANGIQIMENCGAISKISDIEVSLVSAKRSKVNIQNPFEYYNINKTFEFKRIFCLDFLWLPVFKLASFIIQVVSFTISSLIYILVHNHQIDVVYTRDFYVVALASFIKPVFYEVHSLPSKISWMHKMAWKRSKGLIVISQGLLNDLVKFGVDLNKIMIARDGVNVERFDIDLSKSSAREKLNISQEQKVVVYTGHLYEWKGVHTLAQAGLKIPEDIHIYFVGGTIEDVARFREQYKSRNIHMLGHQPQTQIPIWLKAADLLIIPNSAKERISSHYTSPMKLFEYMASSTPIIASSLPSLREVLSDKEAVFFNADDSVDLSEKIEHSMNNINELKESAEIVQEKSKKYNWENRAGSIIKYVRSKI